jgi:hypothetical protein
MSKKARRSLLASVVAAGLVAVAVLVGSSAIASPAGSQRRPHLSERRILGIAKTAAARAGDPRPTLIQHSEGSRHNANLVGGAGDGVNGRQRSYLIAERGHFAYNDVNLGSGPEPHGSVLTLVVNASTGEITDDGLSNQYPDLARLGPVHTDLRR